MLRSRMSALVQRPDEISTSASLITCSFASIGKPSSSAVQRSVRHISIHASSSDECRVRVPPLPVQRRIAGILSAYDELIENSQRRIKILEAMARALYREWFVHFRFPGHENHPRVASPLGEIPKGWEVKKLGEIVGSRCDRNARRSSLDATAKAFVPRHSAARRQRLDASPTSIHRWRQTCSRVRERRHALRLDASLLRQWQHRLVDCACSAEQSCIRLDRLRSAAPLRRLRSSLLLRSTATSSSTSPTAPVGATDRSTSSDVLRDMPIVVPARSRC